MNNRIEFNGKTIEVKELNLSDWSKMMKYKSLYEEEDLYYKLLEEFTGMEKDEILKQDAASIITLGDAVNNMLLYDNKKLYVEIDHKDVKYELVDVNKISFGQFVDIDSFLRKDETYKSQNLHELAAYLYCEKGSKYSQSDFKKRMDQFKDLPVKYINSAVFFFLNLAEASQNLTHLYSKNKMMRWLLRIRIHLMVIGDGIKQSVRSQKTKFGKLIMLLISPLSALLITFLTLLTLIRKGKKN